MKYGQLKKIEICWELYPENIILISKILTYSKNILIRILHYYYYCSEIRL